MSPSQVPTAAPHITLYHVLIADNDVLTMSYLCAFQINALGHSPFCDIFSDLEWERLNYARDLATYYGSGPGNPYGIAMGIPWVEAVINLMLNSSSSNIYLSLYQPFIRVFNVSNI